MSELDIIIESSKESVLPLAPISLDGLLKKLSKHRPDIKSKVKKKIQCTRHADTSQRTNKKEKQAYLISTKELEKAAKKNKDKQYELGMRYDEEAKYSKAYASFDKAAKQGHATAQYRVGLCYDKGRGVEKDEKKAAEWYRQAAMQGEAAAQCNLGLLYFQGICVEKNLKTAVIWYNKAAIQGNAHAYNL